MNSLTPKLPNPEADIDNITNPWVIIDKWYNNACISEVNDPNAASLATVDKNGQASCRVVLLKQITEEGLHFCSQSDSEKGRDISENNQVALVLYWKSLRQQIRFVGKISVLPSSFADKYFAERSRESRIAARISKQSHELQSYKHLTEAYLIEEKKLEGKEVSRLDGWVAYNVLPEYIECWEDGVYRLHKRACFKYTNSTWRKSFLFP